MFEENAEFCFPFAGIEEALEIRAELERMGDITVEIRALD